MSPPFSGSDEHKDVFTRKSKRRCSPKLLILSGICLALFFLYSLSHSSSPYRVSWMRGASDAPAFHHEIQALTDRTQVFAVLEKHARLAKQKFEQWQADQSKDVSQARSKYYNRYRRHASPHFDDWVRFALEHKSVVIDDFDQVEANLAPFRRVPKEAMRSRIQALLDKKGHTGYIRIKDGIITVNGTGPEYQNQRMASALAPMNGTTKLPDLIVPLNWHDSPLQAATFTSDRSSEITFQSDFAGSKWDYMVKHKCDASYITDSAISSDRPTVDVCKQHHLSEMIKDQHGYWQLGQEYITSPFPFLSWAKVSLNTDVIIPETCYYMDDYRNRDDPDTLPFSQKSGSLFWRGSNTGLEGNHKNWMNGHRQRFVRLAHRMSDAIRGEQLHGLPISTSDAVSLLCGEDQPCALATQALQHLKPEVFDASFTRVSCEQDASLCLTVEAEMPLAPSSPRSTMFKHKYLMDVDGNGMSCRYYALLESNSVTLKQTLYAEWHDERLIPWLHYAPVSVGMSELPSLLDAFENSVAGQAIAEDIAKQGKEWAHTALRNIDMTIYFYRLLVGLAEIVG